MVSENEKELESMYGPAAPFSEHKRCDHITYTTAEGPPGVIVWCQAPAGELGVRYNVAPDVASGFVDFVVSGSSATGSASDGTVCDLSQIPSSCLTHNLSSVWLLSLLRSNQTAEWNLVF